MFKSKKAVRIYRNASNRCLYASPRNSKYYIDKGIKFLLPYGKFLEIWEICNADLLIRPSLGRKDHNKDYTFDNCEIMEWEDNRKNRTYKKRLY